MYLNTLGVKKMNSRMVQYMKFKIITDLVTKKAVSYPLAFFRIMKIYPINVWATLEPKLYDITYQSSPLLTTFEDLVTYVGNRESINEDYVKEFSMLDSDFNKAFKAQICAVEPFKDLDMIEFYPKAGSVRLQSFLISHDQKNLITFFYDPLIIDSKSIISYTPRVYDILFSHGTHLVFRDHIKGTEVYILTAKDYPENSYDLFYPDYWVYPKHVQQVLDKYSKVLNPSLHSIIGILFCSVLYKQDVSDVVIYLYMTYNDKEITLTRTEETSSFQTYCYQCENDSLTLHVMPKSDSGNSISRSEKSYKIHDLPDSFSSLEVKVFINNQEVNSDFVKNQVELKSSSSSN